MNVNISTVAAISGNVSGQAGPYPLAAHITSGNYILSNGPDDLASSSNETFLAPAVNNGTPRYDDVILDSAPWSDTTSYITGACCLGIACVGILFNTMVIFSIIQNQQLRSHISNVLICNLAVGSLIGCVIILSVEVPTRLMSKSSSHHVEYTTCDMIGFVTSVLNIGTVWSVVALSIDKYRSIDSPLHHSIVANTVKSVTYLMLIWIIAAVLSSSPFLFGQNYVFQPAEGTCDFRYTGNSMYPYLLVYLGLVFYIPTIVVCFCHWRIFAIARSQSRRMAAMVHLVTLIHVPLLNGRMANQQISPQGRKAIYTTTIFVGTFLACYAPHAIFTSGRLFWDVLDKQLLISITTLLLRSAFTVNIFIYGCRNRMVRDSFAKYVRRKLLERRATLHWKRRHRATPGESRQEIVRADRGPNCRPVLHPVRSQPNLSTVHVTPVLPRAISMDVDITRRTANHVIIHASSSDELTTAHQNSHRIFSINESLQVISEGHSLKPPRDFGSKEDDNGTINTDTGSPDAGQMGEVEEEPDVDTPMLLPEPQSNHVFKTSNQCTDLNGTFPYSPISKRTFVQLKESVV